MSDQEIRDEIKRVRERIFEYEEEIEALDKVLDELKTSMRKHEGDVDRQHEIVQGFGEMSKARRQEELDKFSVELRKASKEREKYSDVVRRLGVFVKNHKEAKERVHNLFEILESRPF